MERFTFTSVLTLVVGLLIAGCDMITTPGDDQHIGGSDNSYQPLTVIGDDLPDELRVGVFTVCKSAPEHPEQAFPFTVSAEGPNVDRATVTSSVDLVDGTCEDVYEITGEVVGSDEVTVTEAVPAGWRVDRVTVCRIDETGTVTTLETTEPTVTEQIIPATRGVLATYTNVLAPTSGGEGCTPGAWKNRLLRLERWPVSENTLVNEVWNVPSGLEGSTLLQALRFGGGPTFEGKVRILLRAATAAYLNALTIEYDLTAQQVIDDANAAIASGDKDTVISLAEELDGLNNQDCPITEQNYGE